MNFSIIPSSSFGQSLFDRHFAGYSGDTMQFIISSRDIPGTQCNLLFPRTTGLSFAQGVQAGSGFQDDNYNQKQKTAPSASTLTKRLYEPAFRYLIIPPENYIRITHSHTPWRQQCQGV
jgi:hypothetical protein